MESCSPVTLIVLPVSGFIKNGKKISLKGWRHEEIILMTPGRVSR
jgi:hypothetical protein